MTSSPSTSPHASTCRLAIAGWAALIAVLLLASQAATAHAQQSLFGDDGIPYGRAPVSYDGPATANPIAKLAAKIAAGRAKLTFEPGHGYLRSLLAALNVPVESQVLVFSKSSLNERLISPRTPRAIYFNDEVYVAWVPGAASLEISVMDRDKGAVFYTLAQQPQEMPRLERDLRCVECHVASHTLDVPGHLLRSFETSESGKLLTGYSQISHDTPHAQRWGGWYVTGKPSPLPHLGNLVGEAQYAQYRQQPQTGGTVADLAGRFDTSAYLVPTSDVVAMLVLDHQVHFQNLCIRLSMETRLGLPTETTARRLARYLLFADAPALPAPVAGTSGFNAWFTRQGQGTAAGRLRKLNLQDRVFEHRLSYLVASSAFDALPAQAKSAVYRHVASLLLGDGQDRLPWPPQERLATWQLLLAVRSDVPEDLRQLAP